MPSPRAILPPRRIADAQVGDHDLPRLRVSFAGDEGVQEAGFGSAHCDDRACVDDERVAVDDGDLACWSDRVSVIRGLMETGLVRELTCGGIETGWDVDCQDGRFESVGPCDQLARDDLIVRSKIVDSGMHA